MDNKIMNLTAEEAKRIQQNHPDRIAQLKGILSSINDHINDYEQSTQFIFWYEKINKITEIKLKEMGYRVVDASDEHDLMYKISWES